jgi:hypothetical protein
MHGRSRKVAGTYSDGRGLPWTCVGGGGGWCRLQTHSYSRFFFFFSVSSLRSGLQGDVCVHGRWIHQYPSMDWMDEKLLLQPSLCILIPEGRGHHPTMHMLYYCTVVIFRRPELFRSLKREETTDLLRDVTLIESSKVGRCSMRMGTSSSSSGGYGSGPPPTTPPLTGVHRPACTGHRRSCVCLVRLCVCCLASRRFRKVLGKRGAGRHARAKGNMCVRLRSELVSGKRPIDPAASIVLVSSLA